MIPIACPTQTHAKVVPPLGAGRDKKEDVMRDKNGRFVKGNAVRKSEIMFDGRKLKGGKR